MQATVEELNTTNDDLAARGAELEQTARRLEAERVRLAAILTTMADGVLVVDGAGRVLLANEAFEAMFGPAGAGLVPEDNEGRPLPLEAGPAQRVAAGEVFELEFRVAAQGSTRRFEASGRPFSAAADQGGVLVVRDVTDRSLLRLQNAFLSLATHELNTPLTAISGSLQVLLRQADSANARAQRRHFAEMGLAQVRRLGVLVQELGACCARW